METLLQFLNAERGRRIALSAHLKLSPAAVSSWREVPARHVRAVSQFSGIPPEVLRPDLADIFGVVDTSGRVAMEARS